MPGAAEPAPIQTTQKPKVAMFVYISAPSTSIPRHRVNPAGDDHEQQYAECDGLQQRRKTLRRANRTGSHQSARRALE